MSAERPFGTQLREALIAVTDLSQAEVGRMVGLHESEISNYVHGKRWPEPEMIERLLEIMKVRPAQQLRGIFEGTKYEQNLIDRFLTAPSLLTRAELPELLRDQQTTHFLRTPDLITYYAYMDGHGTQSSVARTISVSQSHVTRLLQETRNAKKSIITKFATGLQVPSSELAQFYATLEGFSPPFIGSAISARRIAIGLDQGPNFPITP